MLNENEAADTTSILIVDDHELAVSGLRLLIQEPQYEIVDNLKTGAEVAQFFNTKSADIVLLDLGLPDVDGLTLLSELVAVHDATVIVLSGISDATQLISASKLGARAVVSKSDPSAVILEAINAVNRGEQFTSPYVSELFASAEPSNTTLSPRQMAILRFLAAGETNKEIGYRLRIAPPTVSFHLREIREKLGVDSNRKIVEAARVYGLI